MDIEDQMPQEQKDLHDSIFELISKHRNMSQHDIGYAMILRSVKLIMEGVNDKYLAIRIMLNAMDVGIDYYSEWKKNIEGEEE